MTFITRFRTLRRALMLSAFTATIGLACSPSETLEITDPDIIDPTAVNSAAGAAAVYAGAMGDFTFGLVGDNGGTEGLILVGGLMSDEFVHSGTFPTRLEYERRAIDDRNATLLGIFRQAQRGRALAEAAIPLLRQYAPTPVRRVGEMFAVSAMIRTFFGEMYCSGVPFSTAYGGVQFGQPQSTSDVFTTAIQLFDSAMANVGATAADSAILNFAKVGKGRALLNLGQFSNAAAAVAGVPLNFSYNTTHNTNSGRQQNGIHVFNWLSERWSVADVEGTNGLNFRSANDPRVTYFRDATGTGVGFDATTPQWNQRKYGSPSARTPIAQGVEARLIVAEALLQTPGNTAWLDTLNSLRANAAAVYANSVEPGYFTGTLAPLADPGTPAARLDLLFRERAFWLYATGHRLGDMRRLIRQYSRSPESVFPTGAHFKGSPYGTDVNVPVPFNERNNPNFSGCIDRGA